MDNKNNNATPLEEAFAQQYRVPIERAKDFAIAFNALVADARSDDPRLVPQLAANALNGRPSTVVTDILRFPSLDFPIVAPEKWESPGKGHTYKEGEETPMQFAVRVYGKWMRPDAPHLSIGMPEILHLDEPLYHSLRRRPDTEKPEGYFLPSKKERNDAHLALHTESSSKDMIASEFLRLASAKYRRELLKNGKNDDQSNAR